MKIVKEAQSKKPLIEMLDEKDAASNENSENDTGLDINKLNILPQKDVDDSKKEESSSKDMLKDFKNIVGEFDTLD